MNDDTLDIMQPFTMIDENRCGQYTSRVRATAEACKLNRITGQPHYVMLNTCYRVNMNVVIVPRLCWTIRISAGRFRDVLTACRGSYPGAVVCVA